MELTNKFILDACCSVKAMWYNKNHPNAVYIDIRKEPSGFLGYGRKEELNPDYIMDFRKMDFPDNTFKLVVFEPPHLSKLGKTSYFRKKFGCLNAETWQDDLKRGFSECWRVLDDYGTLIFKWSDSEIPFQKVLNLIRENPLFYNVTNNKSTSVTKWFCFMKIPIANGGTNFTSAFDDGCKLGREKTLKEIEDKIQTIFKEELGEEKRLGQYSSAQDISNKTLKRFHEWLQQEVSGANKNVIDKCILNGDAI